jgi:hypothetical protein
MGRRKRRPFSAFIQQVLRQAEKRLEIEPIMFLICFFMTGSAYFCNK